MDDAVNDVRTSDDRAIELHGVAARAGYPIEGANGAVLGTFCLLDTRPLHWTDRDVQILATLSQAASTEIALRQAQVDLLEAGNEIEALRGRLSHAQREDVI